MYAFKYKYTHTYMFYIYMHIKTHICSITKRILKMQRVTELCQTEATPLPCSSMLQPPLRTGMLGYCHTAATFEVLAVPAPTCSYSCWRAATSLPRLRIHWCPGHRGRDVRCRALLSALLYLWGGLAEGDVAEQHQSTLSYGCCFKRHKKQ